MQIPFLFRWGASKVTGREYLDKIIHIPFSVPTANQRRRQQLVNGILAGDDKTVKNTIPRLQKAMTTGEGASHGKKAWEKGV